MTENQPHKPAAAEPAGSLSATGAYAQLVSDIRLILERWHPLDEAATGAGDNALGASNDIEAAARWLHSYSSVGKTRTCEAYQREVTRFLIWCKCESRIGFSSLTLNHAQAYQRFLAAVPARYITTLRVGLQDPRWRPWRGQLDQRSQNYALQVLAQFFSELHVNGYLLFNPFASLKRVASGARVMDTTRTLSEDDLAWVQRQLALIASDDDLSASLDLAQMHKLALARRTRLIIHLLVATGMRLDELATASLIGLRKAWVDGREREDILALEIKGKGGKLRDILLKEQLITMVHQHHADAVAVLQRVGGRSSEKRIASMKLRPPLVCAIMAPPGRADRAIDDEAKMANDNLGLSRIGLYKTLKSFFRTATRAPIRDAEKRLRKLQDLNAPTAELSVAEQELLTWRRRARMSTHWLRHTFAHRVLRFNANDEGLKLAQELLGHANISTTAQYLKQDESARVRAIERLPTLGM